MHTQDCVDPLLFNNTGEEITIPIEAIKVMVNNTRVTFEETLETDEDEYYLLLALLNGLQTIHLPMRLKDNLLRRLLGGKKTSTIQ